MVLNLCTLFDSNYLDKGLVLYKSLEKCCENFMLFILPMDDKCREVLDDLGYRYVEILDYSDFEDDDLKKVKRERSRAEFCWTCTAKLIKYVFDKYDKKICTYIDADLYFYEDPQILIEEMLQDNASVQIVEHNFRRFTRKASEQAAGRFCVEFNTFLNNAEGRNVLEQWEKDCVRDCSYNKNEGVMGDQKYLHSWPEKYTCINICKNQGAGVAPWNVNKFRYEMQEHNSYRITDIESKKKYQMVFYHFQNIRFIEADKVVCCDVDRRIKKEVTSIYMDYLCKIKEEKTFLYNQYGIESLIKVHPADENYEHVQKRFIDSLKDGEIKELGEIFKALIGVVKAKFDKVLYTNKYEELIIELEN
ncbi:MAG: hypothetical protein J1E64_00500 [Acetatifactor sp.]|nr:hypothetical protein [Acetatifactor sp.]